jgi:GTPase SAR1 family protein
MKLALIGTHGVGKTTLAYEICSLLKKANHNVELVTEVARQSLFPVNAATTLEGQLWILHAQIAAELEAARRAPHVICDRSVLDNYCYLVNKFDRQPQLESWLGWWMDSYTLLAGVPPIAGSIVPDGFRSEDRAFQERIHDLLGELLDAPKFRRYSERVIWLRAEGRNEWGNKIFRAALRLIEADVQAVVAPRSGDAP